MLNNAQLAILKAAIQANTELAQFITDGADSLIAEYYNQPSTFIVWRTRVNVEDIQSSSGFTWTSVDSLTVGKARIWEWLTRFGSINPSQANVRQGIQDAFAGISALQTAIAAVCKRPANRGENLFTTGTGTTANPGFLGYEGIITADDVAVALRG